MIITNKIIFGFPKLIIFVFMLILNGQIFGQTVDSVEFKGGHFSIRYQIGHCLHISSFNGNFISVKYKTSTNYAYVFGLSGSYKNTNGDSKTSINEELYSFPDDESAYNIGLYIQMQYQINTSTDMSFYFGIGTFIGTSYSENSGFNYYYRKNPPFRADVEKYDKKYLGCSFNIGGEYFILKKLSVLAESSIEPSFQKRSYRNIEVNDDVLESSSTNSWEIDTTVKFGFAFHFSR